VVHKYVKAFRSCQFALACVLAIGTAGASQVQSLTDLRNDQPPRAMC